MMGTIGFWRSVLLLRIDISPDFIRRIHFLTTFSSKFSPADQLGLNTREILAAVIRAGAPQFCITSSWNLWTTRANCFTSSEVNVLTNEEWDKGHFWSQSLQWSKQLEWYYKMSKTYWSHFQAAMYSTVGRNTGRLSKTSFDSLCDWWY